jgi:hypothetical protein
MMELEGWSRYFLAQTLVNALFGTVVAIGLTLIGVPNQILWGILGMVLRFVPYLGAWIAASVPIAISFAVDPGWSMTVWTAAFLLSVELLIGQAIEPFLYGHRTGVTPVAVIVSATFWTWLWGPVGLLLSMPLTVCLGVLGRHIESLEFLEIMIGDEPPLTPAQSFYHRALSGSENEAIDQVEEALKEGKDLATCYQEIVLEALVLAEVDRHRGVLDDDHADKMNQVVQSVLAELADQEELPITVSSPPDEPETAKQDGRVSYQSQQQYLRPQSTGQCLSSAGRASSTIRSGSCWRSCWKGQECRRNFSLTSRCRLCISLDSTRLE